MSEVPYEADLEYVLHPWLSTTLLHLILIKMFIAFSEQISCVGPVMAATMISFRIAHVQDFPAMSSLYRRSPMTVTIGTFVLFNEMSCVQLY